MKVENERGLEIIKRTSYIGGAAVRLVQQSSVIGEYEPSLPGADRPGSSFLWIGEKHHLSREQVTELIEHLQSWVDTGSLNPAIFMPTPINCPYCGSAPMEPHKPTCSVVTGKYVAPESKA